MRYLPIEQETQPIFLRLQEPTRNSANAHHAVEELREQN
jgi:hypothetical protein